MLMPPLAPLTPDKGHIEVEDVGSSAGLPITPPEMVPPKEADDDSITRCICDFVHDDGYMICCDKCRYDDDNVNGYMICWQDNDNGYMIGCDSCRLDKGLDYP